MNAFIPERDIQNSYLALLPDGKWPSFHDAQVTAIHFDRGDIRPADDIWIGAIIKVTVDLLALTSPLTLTLMFHDCDSIVFSGFDHINMIYDLTFSLVERGFYEDGVSPLLPYICISFNNQSGFTLSFKCFRIEVLQSKPLSIKKLPNNTQQRTLDRLPS